MADAVLPDRKIRRTPATKRRPRFRPRKRLPRCEGRHGAQHTRPAIAIRPAWARRVRMAATLPGKAPAVRARTHARRVGPSRKPLRAPTSAHAGAAACPGNRPPQKNFRSPYQERPGAATKLHGMRSRPIARPVRQGQPCPAAPTTPARKENTMKQHAMIAAALGSLLALGAVSTPAQAADPAAGKENATAWPRPARTTAPAPAALTPAPASPRSTRTRCRGSSSRPAPARRWAACCSSLPSKPRTG